MLQKDPSLLDAEARAYAHLPGGHQEAWADAFCNLMRDIYGFIADGQEAVRRASAGLRDVRRRLPRQLHRRGDPRERAASGSRRSVERDKVARSIRPRELERSMKIQPFEPKFMKVGVLTAALQELTPREVRDPDPDRAIEEWLEFAQGSRRELHPAFGGAAPERNGRAARGDARSGRQHARPAEAVRQGPRAARRGRARRDAESGISDVGYFDNLLHHDPAIRKKKHDFMLRVFDAAALLGVDAVCGFVGRNQQRSMDQNLDRLRGAVRAAAEGSEGARPDLPRRAVPDARLDDAATTGTTTSPTRRAPGSRCIGSARSTASATSSASTTIRRTPS